MQSGLSTCGGNRANAAFQSCNALFQHCVGGIADAAVNVPRAFQIKQRGSMVAGFKYKRCGEMNRCGPRTCCRVRACTSMQSKGVKTWVVIARHGFLGCMKWVLKRIVGYIWTPIRGGSP